MISVRGRRDRAEHDMDMILIMVPFFQCDPVSRCDPLKDFFPSHRDIIIDDFPTIFGDHDQMVIE